jgi:Flp pilus assembly protein TadD
MTDPSGASIHPQGKSLWPRIGQAAVIALAAWAALSPALHGGWLWDDPVEVARNPVLRDPAGLARIWAGSVGPDYFPLKTSVQWLQWHLWGDRLAGYHWTNLALHVLSSLLVWRLLSRLGIGFAFWGGLLFAVHPETVESVAWITELKNTLSLPLLLGAMLSYLTWDEGARNQRNKPALYALSVCLFALAMLAKSSVAMFPLVLLLHGWWRRGGIRRRDLAAAAPFLVVSAILGLVTIRFQEARVIAPLAVATPGLLARVCDAGWAVWFYLGKALAPFGLLPIYPDWPLHPAWLWLLPPWIAVGGLFWWLCRLGISWSRAAVFGLGTFVLNLVPVLGIVPMAFLRISWVSDHFMYVSLVSAMGLAVGGASLWATGPVRRRIASAVLAVVAIAFLAGSRRYARVFQSEEALWTYAVRGNPGAWLAHNNLEIVYAGEGRIPEALVEGQAATELRPGFAEARSNYGLTLTRAGKFNEAIAELRAAIALDPGLTGARINLGRVLYFVGRMPEAEGEFEAVLRIDPGNAEARGDLRATHNAIGAALARSGRLPEAVAEFEKAVETDPGHPGTRRNLARALQALGRDAEAEAQIEEADRLERHP